MKLFKELCNEIFDMNINVIIGKIKVNKNGKMNKEKQKITLFKAYKKQIITRQTKWINLLEKLKFRLPRRQ